MAAGILEVTEVKPDYLNSDILMMPDYRLIRIDSKGYRYYGIKQQGGDYQFFISNTSLIEATMPTPSSLIDWMVSTPNYKEYSRERADYGTMMHIMYGWFMIEKKIDLIDLDTRLRASAAAKGIDFREYWTNDLKDDLLAFAAFVNEHNVEPLAIEVSLVSKDGYGGTLDLICRMDWEFKGHYGEVYKSGPQKGAPKETKETRRIVALVDFKSGRKGFYESNEIQMEACRRLCIENFGVVPDMLFNFSPKEWRNTPTYNLKDQTDAVSKIKFDHLVQIAKIEKLMDVRQISVYDGVLEFGQAPGDDCFKKVDMNTYLKNTQKRIA